MGLANVRILTKTEAANPFGYEGLLHLTDSKLLGTFQQGHTKVFPDRIEIDGNKLLFSDLHHIEGEGTEVIIVLHNGLPVSLSITGEEIVSASNFKIMVWRAYKLWKKDPTAGSHGVVGY